MAQGGSGGPAEDSPGSAATYVRTSAPAIRTHHETIGDGITFLRAERKALCEWAKINGKQIPFNFAVGKFKPVGSGAEHDVYYDEPNLLAVKVNRDNRFGHSVYDRNLQATPSEYLQRLEFCNQIFGDEYRILGVACDDSRTEIVSAHRWIEGHKDRAVPSDEEIFAYLRRFGFERCGGSPEAPLFYNDDLGLLLADAHDTNVIRDRDGNVIAIDVVIGYPGPKMRAELQLPGLGVLSGVTGPAQTATGGAIQSITGNLTQKKT